MRDRGSARAGQVKGWFQNPTISQRYEGERHCHGPPSLPPAPGETITQLNPLQSTENNR
jgi:hypothetical protein